MSYEMCALCESLRPSAEMQTIYVTDPTTRRRTPLRFCRSCLYPRTTYIQAQRLSRLSVHRSLSVSAIMTAALGAVMVFFGAIIGPTYGTALMLAGILTGACVLIALVVASCIPRLS